jgi:hypothetical protein
MTGQFSKVWQGAISDNSVFPNVTWGRKGVSQPTVIVAFFQFLESRFMFLALFI